MVMRIALLAATLAGTALAQQPAPPSPAFAAANLSPKGIAAMAGACAMCHGSEGVPVAGSTLAPLAGRPAQGIIDAMKDFRDAKRNATIMHQIAKGYSDSEVAAIAQYFAAPRQAP